MKIVTWNVNSVNARLERVVAFIEREQPDVLCLQELKCTTENFPWERIEALGYHCHVYGQKAYNGVATLVRKSLHESSPSRLVDRGFGTYSQDDAARSICIEIKDRTILNVYVPNGQSKGSDKFHYKMNWLTSAKNYLDGQFKSSQQLLVCGDFNIAPQDLDVYDPVAWRDHIHCTPEERAALNQFASFGLVDLQRVFDDVNPCFTWWDYREGSFQRNRGLRIDLMLATPRLTRLCSAVRVDHDERSGDKPSDHAPVIATFN